jgi:DNA-binding winged helix-turn-helix (wHTH) protein/TolB-like protein/Flp pilus assembly protein TadD
LFENPENVMTSGKEPILEFGEFRLEVAKRTLLDRDGRVIKLMPKAFDLLAFLIANNERVVSKDELMAQIWSDTVVEENNLTQNISSLRRVFGEKPHENRFISTIPGRGYRFVAEVRQVEPVAEDRAVPEHNQYGEYTTEITKDGSSTFRQWLPVAVVTSLAVISVFAYFQYNSSSGNQEVRTLAVLPFKPITPETSDEALEMGMADSLIAKLTAGGELRVMPLAAVRGLTNQNVDTQNAGRRMSVDAVLDGVMQIAGNRLRVSAKLIRVSDGRQLWAGQFDEELRDIFSVQDSISDRVANALAVRLRTDNKTASTTNPEAYQLFMRGKFHAYKLVLNELQKGIGYYEQAISIDPNYALAYVELANAYRAMVLTNDAAPAEMMARAKAAASKAVELDPNLAEAWTALAFGNFWFDWNWQLSESNFKKALAIDSNSAHAHAFYAHLLSNIGRHAEATKEIRRAREIDPINPLFGAVEGQTLFFADREADSSVVLRSLIDLDPNFWLAHLFICRNYMSKGMFEEALAAATKAKDITRGNAEAIGTSGYILAKMGRVQAARQILAVLEGRKDKPFSAYSTAQVYIGLGERERALEKLEQAFKQNEPLMVFLKIEPRWNELRAEPRFMNLMRQMNFE